MMDINSIQELSTMLQKTVQNHIVSRGVEIKEKEKDNPNIDFISRSISVAEAEVSLKMVEMFIREQVSSLSFSSLICSGSPSLREKVSILWEEKEKKGEKNVKSNPKTGG
jgi:CTP synthase (UTP-ammonia lyase)